MRSTIKNLKTLTGHSSYPKLAKFFGVCRATVNRVVAGEKVTFSKTLPMLEYLLDNLSEKERKQFLNKFKEKK